VQNFHFEQRAQ